MHDHNRETTFPRAAILLNNKNFFIHIIPANWIENEIFYSRSFVRNNLDRERIMSNISRA